MFYKVVLILLLCAVITVDNARILGVFHMPSFSHNIVGKTLLKALAEKGHEVTMISPFPLETPMTNYEDIYLDGIMKFQEEGAIEMMMEAENGPVFQKIEVIQNLLYTMHEMCLNHTLLTKLLNSNRNFDLVIMDWALNDAMLGIAHHFKAPVIIISAVGSSMITNKITVNSAPYAYVPNLLFTYTGEMTFLQRVLNTVSTIFLELINHFSQEPTQELYLRRYFPNAPPIKELIQNISLVFLNSHFSIESPRPYVPNMIQIAGLHLEEPKELENDLKTFMDGASEGVLYFSLGGNVQSSNLTPEKMEAIIKTLGKLPVKVLWKYETDDASKLPANVKAAKWFPQRDILAHPNLKVFVTHGGLLSTIESVYRGVPMVGIPCVADQEGNVKLGVHNGYSTMVTLKDINEASLTDAIMEVLNNPSYRENVKKRSIWLKDQPIKPLDNAIFWVEYILKHRGAPHLQTSAIKLNWYQYLLLDVFVFVAGIAAVICLVFSKIIKLLIRLVFKKKSISQTNIEIKKVN